MVKRGGTKKKISIEKIENKEKLRVTCTKRRDGLFSKASQLCLLSSGSQMAVLSKPPSSDSYVSFHSFGHSSVDVVVSAFLSGNPPPPLLEDSKEMREDVAVCLARKDLGLGFWWENESLVNSKNPQEVSDRIDSMKTLLANLRHLRAEERTTLNVQTTLIHDPNTTASLFTNSEVFPVETTNPPNMCSDSDDFDWELQQSFIEDDLRAEQQAVNGQPKSDAFLNHANQDQTLIHQSSSAICCVLPESFNEIPGEPHQTLNLESITSEICCVPHNLLVPDNEFNANFNEITEEQDHISANCETFFVEDNNKDAPLLEDNSLDYIRDIEELIDFSSPIASSFDNWVSENSSYGNQLCV